MDVFSEDKLNKIFKCYEGQDSNKIISRESTTLEFKASFSTSAIPRYAKTMAAFGIPVAESIQWRKMLIKPENFLSYDEKLVKTLSDLQSKYKIISVTNNPVSTARKTLQALGVSEFFPEIIGLDSTGLSKPHYLPFSMALEKLGLEAKDCVAVGDRFNIDVELPLKMGMGGVLVEGVEEVYNLAKLFG